MTFRVLDDAVLDEAVSRARLPFDRDKVRRAARRAGAAVVESPVDDAARTLLRLLATGHHPSPGLVQLLRESLDVELGTELDTDDSMALWVGASLEHRAEAVADLLDFGDRLPAGREGPLLAPRLGASRRG